MTFSILGTDTQTNQRVELPQASRREGLYIIGATGTGKSTLLENLILQDIDQQIGVCVLDPHGDLVNAVLSRMKKRLEDVILIDLGSREYVTGLNLFHCEHPDDAFEAVNVVQAVMHILEKVYHISRDTPLMNQYFINIAKTLIYNPQATVLDIPRLLTDATFRASLLANVPDDDVHWFWTELYEQQRRGRRSDEILSMVTDKLVEFNSRVLKPWFGQNTQTLNLRRIMDERKILLVKLKARWQSMTSLIGSILIAQILDAAYSREDTRVHKRKQFNVYADEFQTFASQDFAQLFTEARKYGIGITISHQVFEQLDDTIKATIKQAANIVVFRVSSDNAKEIAGEFDCTPPPGEPIYEKIMRRITKTEHKVWWEPPEAEEECKQAFLDLKPVEIAQHVLLQFGIGTENVLYDEKRGRYGESYKEPFPFALPPVPANEPMAVITLDNKNFTVTNPKNWDTTVHVYSQPLVPGAALWNYLVKLYKYNEYGSFIDYAFGNPELISYLLDTYYYPVPTEEPIYSDYWEKTWWGGEKHVKKHITTCHNWVLNISPHVRAGVPYRFPIISPTKIEEHIQGRFFHQWTLSQPHDLLDSMRQGFLQEVGAVLQPFIKQAVFYFDPEGYKSYPIDNYVGGRLVVEHDGKRRAYPGGTEGADPMGGYRLSKHWKGPSYPDEHKVWVALLRWAKQKILEVDRQKNELVQKLQQLVACRHEGEEEIFLGWYEPVRITEWEFRNVGGFLHGHNDLIQTEREIYRMRMGPSPYGTDEVERRIANQIKSLPKFTARVRIASGEYTIITDKPSGYSREQELQQRIHAIHEQNKKDGYIRLRSEVEAELGHRRQGVQLVQSQKPQPHFARTVAVQGKCPTCGFSKNAPGAKFCNQCGTKL